MSPVINLLKNKTVEESVTEILQNISSTDTAQAYDNSDFEKYKEVKENAVKTGFVDSLKGDVTNKLKEKGVLEMKKWGKVFVLTGSIVAMLITGTGCSKKNTGIKNPVDEEGNMTGSK